MPRSALWKTPWMLLAAKVIQTSIGHEVKQEGFMANKGDTSNEHIYRRIRDFPFNLDYPPMDTSCHGQRG